MSAAPPIVTVAMPVYNGGDDLRLAVQSILDQTLPNWELVIVDDGSTDQSVANLAVDDPRIKIMRDGQNRGLATRLNQIIDMVHTPFLARMDHDDVAHPERLAKQVAWLERHDHIDLVAARCLTMSNDLRIIGELPFDEEHAEICRRPWRGFYLAHPTWTGRTDWFRSHRYASPAPYCCEDQELLLRARNTSHFHALPEPLLAYRVRGKFPFRKLFRTRTAWVGVQTRQFIAERHFGGLALCLATYLIRVASDVLREVLPHLRSDVRRLRSNSGSWSEVIASAAARSQLLGGSHRK